MSVKNVEKLEKNQVALTVEVGAAEFNAAIEKAYRKMVKKINVPGFRVGKAPRKVIEGMYGVEVFFEEAINIAFPEAYEAAVKEQELQVVGYPEVEMVGECTREGFTFKAVAPVYPEVTLGEYKGLSAEKDEVKVMAADVNERLKSMQDRNSRLVSVERAAKNGDTAVIDFEGFLDGVPFEGGKAENHSLELGSNSFVPGFEEQIVGMKAGEEKDIDITFPENYTPELAGAAVVFHVKVNEVKETVLPELDDEFAKDVSEFDTLEEYKSSLKAEIESRKSENAEKDFKDAALQKAVENMEVEVPDVMVDEQVDRICEDYARNCAMQGMEFGQYLGMMGMDEMTFRSMIRPSASNDVRTQIFLEACAEAEGIVISEEDIDAEYTTAAEAYSMDVEELKKAVSTEIIARDLKMRKAADVVAEAAVATDKKAEDAE